MRFALTSRYIKPENIDRQDHWKGKFTIPANEVWDGSVEAEDPFEDSSSDDIPMAFSDTNITTNSEASSPELPDVDPAKLDEPSQVSPN